MALTYSQPFPSDSSAPDFDLPVANPQVLGDERITLKSLSYAQVLVVIFTCNHCPYAKHVESALSALAKDVIPQGAAFIAINSNDTSAYPEDDFAQMAVRADDAGFPFPYALDEDQSVAAAYGAVCTPDIYVFDRERRLAYHGRFDDTRPGMGEAHGSDLQSAIDAVLSERPVPEPHHPSMGCNIKWLAGNAPA